MRSLRYFIVFTLLLAGASNLPPAFSQEAKQETEDVKAPSKFFDAEDGWFDVSGFLATAYGFVPIAVPITEPAIGYGVGGGLVFIKRNDPTSDGKPQRPDLSAVGGAWTENDTKMLFAGNSSVWLDGKLQTLVGGMWGDIHLEFAGLGTNGLADPVHYKIKVYGGGVQVRYRIGKSPWLAGLGYLYGDTKTSLEQGPNFPSNISPKDFDSTIAGIAPTLIYDTRDNIFTPSNGYYGELTVPIHGEAFGGDQDFHMIQLTFIGYRPIIDEKLYLGLKVDGQGSYGDAPFFTRPFIQLRGVEAMRYQGQYVAEGEMELRWQFTKRFSAVGFAGYGYTKYDIGGYSNNNHVTSGGVGIRYLLARKFGLHMGIDVAWGPDAPIFYIQFGSAWMRP